jgi:plastocyanin
MRSKKVRAVAGVAVAAAVSVGVVGGAGAQDYNVPKNATVKMVLKGKIPKFTGDKTVSKGGTLTIVNTTKVQAIGPHTLTLVKPGKVPEGKAAIKACSEDLADICGVVAKAHKVNTKTFAVGKPLVDVGKKGWDKSFGKKGDTYYTETKGEKYTAKVTAKVGTTLTYMCIVHANMTGTLKVVK